MQEVQERRLIAFIIALSIVLNMSVLVFFFCFDDTTDWEPAFTITLDDLEQEQPKTQTSFDDEPDTDHKEKFEPPEEWDFQVASHGDNGKGNTIVVDDKAPLLQEIIDPPEKVQLSDPLQKKDTELADEEETSDENKEETADETSDEFNDEEQTESPETQDDEHIIEPEQYSVILKEEPKTKKSEVKKKNPFTSNTAQSKLRQLTLADIAKDVARKVRETKDQEVENVGLYLPAQQHTSLRIYQTKFMKILANAFNVNHRLVYSSQDLTVDTTLKVTIEKDGRIGGIEVTPTIPEKELREYFFDTVYKAGLFPPIPQTVLPYLHNEKLTFNVRCSFDIKQGFTNYYLNMNIFQDQF